MTADARGFIGCSRHGTADNHKELVLDQHFAIKKHNSEEMIEFRSRNRRYS